MIKTLLKDQFPSGKHFAPNNETMSDFRNCPTTNILSERDFAWYEQKQTQNPTLSNIAVCEVITFNNQKSGDWLDQKLKNLLKFPDTTTMIGLKNKKIEKKIFCQTKLIKWERLNLKKRLNCRNSMIKENI